MQIPLIRRIAVATERATEAFVAGTPIGDGIGPLVAARLMKGGAKIYAEEEFAVAPAVIAKRKVLVSKASGPGASVGYPGKFMTKLLKTEKIDRIITVDAGMRLEGEKPGSVAEGVGVAMGGVGTERYEIEELAVKNNIPLDAIVIKENEEEAFEGMRMEVLNSVPAALQAIEAAVKRSPVKERILLIGVGNTCGIGNDQKAAAMVAEKVKAYVAKAKAEEAKKKKRFFGLFD
jgi:hypothetical protein